MTTLINSVMTDKERRLLVDEMIIDEPSNNRFKVHRHAFTDEDVLDAERKLIFGHCWLYLGHESEVAEPKSFVTRTVAGRRLIFSRDRKGKLHVFFNSCSHRGALVCRERRGKRANFLCPYHAWNFNDEGKLMGVPGRERFDDGIFARDDLNLKEVPRVESCYGFVFVCFDAEAMSLAEYLGDVQGVLETLSLHGPEGMEIVGGTHEYSINANWKLLFENSADGYHGFTTHITYFEYLQSRDGKFQPQEAEATVIGVGAADYGWKCLKGAGGHSMIESGAPWGRPLARWVPGFGEEAKEEIAALGREVIERLGEEKGRYINLVDYNCLIFPNFVINDLMAVTLRTFLPIRTNYMEVNGWNLAPIGESESSRARRNMNFVEFFGPAGFASPDDVEMLEMCQQGYGTLGGMEWNDISRGMNFSLDEQGADDEEQMRTFWRKWHSLVSQA